MLIHYVFAQVGSIAMPCVKITGAVQKLLLFKPLISLQKKSLVKDLTQLSSHESTTQLASNPKLQIGHTTNITAQPNRIEQDIIVTSC